MTKWLALDNISLARKGDPGRQTDLIMHGETFEAADRDVEALLRPKMGPPRIMKASDQAAAPTYRPRDLSGPLRGPEQGARPDPAGSSRVQVLQDIPELTEPSAGSENEDAIDLPPGTRITAGV